MKNVLFTTFRILIALVLLGKIFNWFLKFGEETNQILNAAMFSLIGISYIVMGSIWEKRALRVLITGCGLFLIARNFFDENITLSIIAITCILVPMLVARFEKRGNAERIKVERG